MPKSSQNKTRSVLELSENEARDFFLKPTSYCDFELPPYSIFSEVLQNSADYIKGRNLPDFYGETKPRDCEGVNHLLLSNKDGRYAWRPFELIHPVLYSSLVNKTTEKASWDFIKDRFSQFQESEKIQCMSIPVESNNPKCKDKEAQILNWWQAVEQRSIELALDYNSVLFADITDCYGQIYTHSIPWALHTKQEAKKKRNDKSLLGNLLDKGLQDMRYGQTNGIPQGSVFMDFIAEMILGYIDTELADKIESEGVNDYHILRYRDDYRIFVNSIRSGEKILKALSEVLVEFGFKLNSFKTAISEDIVSSSIKRDKLAWICQKQREENLEKHLLIIHDFARKHPNSASLLKGLSAFLTRIRRKKSLYSTRAMISIVVNLACTNPKVYPLCAAILSKLLSCDKGSERQEIFNKIHSKFTQIPNTAYMELWLQRVAFPQKLDLSPLSALGKQAAGDSQVRIWNSDWISSNDLQAIVRASIIDEAAKAELTEIISSDEVELFLRREEYL